MKKSLGYKILRHIKNYVRSILEFTREDFTVQALELIKEHYLEKKLNIQTDESYSFVDTSSLFKDAVDYVPTPYRALEKIIGYLKPAPEDIFIDLGCGKGRVVFFAALQKLKKVIGIELNQELIDIARRNLANFKLNKTAVEFINDDVANLKIKDETIFFMFDPFGHETLLRVIDSIKNSLADNPRQICIVYYGPRYRNLLDNQNWLIMEKEIKSCNCLVWHNKF